MAIDLERFKELKDKLEQRRNAAAQAEGRLQSLMERLRDDYNCKTVGAANKKLKSLERDLKKAEGEYDKLLEEEERYDDERDSD